MHVGMSRAASVESLEGSKTMLGTSSLEAATALTTGRLGDLQLAVEHMYLCCDIEYSRIGLVVLGKFGNQPPVIHVAGQINGLVVQRRLSRDGIHACHCATPHHMSPFVSLGTTGSHFSLPSL